MAFTDQKITRAEIASSGLQSQPNKLTGSAQQNKQAFDNLIEAVVMVKFNALIDELRAITAAGQIGVEAVDGFDAQTVKTVQDALEAILSAMQDMTQGSVADGSITAPKLAPGAVTGPKLSGVLPANVGIKYGTATPTAATLSEGEIYLKYSEDG